MNRLLISLALMALLGACGSSPAPRYYTLGAGADIAPAIGAEADALSIWVAPVALPEAVDRPQLVARVAPNRVAILHRQRRAEPLACALSRPNPAGPFGLPGGRRVAA